MLADLLGKPLAGVISFPTVRDPKQLVAALAARIKALLGRASRSRRLRRHRRRGARHGRALDDDRAARADARAGATSTCATRSRPRPACPVQIENSGRACALAQMWALRGDSAVDHRRPRVRQRLGRRRRRRDHQRRGAARPAQHRRRVRPRAAVARRPALLVRRQRLLGSLRLEPRDARALLRPPAAPRRARARRPPAVHHRGPDRARARRRRQGGRRARGDRALSRTRPGVGHQRARSGARLHRRRNHAGVGPHRRHRARRAGRARADRRRRRKPTSVRWRPASIRACRAPRRSSRRRPSPRRSSRDAASGQVGARGGHRTIGEARSPPIARAEHTAKG